MYYIIWYVCIAQVLIIAVCIISTCSRNPIRSRELLYFGYVWDLCKFNFLATAFKKVIATEQKLLNVSTANGTIDAL